MPFKLNWHKFKQIQNTTNVFGIPSELLLHLLSSSIPSTVEVLSEQDDIILYLTIYHVGSVL